MHIRAATAADAPAIAEVHVRSWRWAYRGVIADEALQALTVDEREVRWRERLADRTGTHHAWVADMDGRVVGFAYTGPSRDPFAGFAVGEVYAIYVDPDAIGTGVGRTLLAEAVEGLLRQGYRTATLWVLRDNEHARRFYDAAGWTPDGSEKVEDFRGVPLHEVRYRMELG